MQFEVLTLLIKTKISHRQQFFCTLIVLQPQKMQAHAFVFNSQPPAKMVYSVEYSVNNTDYMGDISEPKHTHLDRITKYTTQTHNSLSLSTPSMN